MKHYIRQARGMGTWDYIENMGQWRKQSIRYRRTRGFYRDEAARPQLAVLTTVTVRQPRQTVLLKQCA